MRSRGDLMEKAVYGLPELNGEPATRCALVANPGCYPLRDSCVGSAAGSDIVDREKESFRIRSPDASAGQGRLRAPTLSVRTTIAYSVCRTSPCGEILEQLKLDR